MPPPYDIREVDGRGPFPVSPGGYVDPVNIHTTFVAGERLTNLEDALDGLTVSDLPCGCLGFSGTIEKWLSQSLERALKTIDAELAERAETQELDNESMDSVRELLVRLGLAQIADD